MPITFMNILAYIRSYPKTVLGPVPTLCPVPGYDVGKVQKLEITGIILLPYPIPVPMVTLHTKMAMSDSQRHFYNLYLINNVGNIIVFLGF